MSKLVMGYWDCPFCGSKGIRGDVVNCPSCGRARGDVQFYMKDYTEGETREANERSDIEYLSEEQAKYVSKNPDWYCSFCNSLNSDNAQFCGNCGASRADSESNYFQRLEERKAREAAEAAANQAPQKQSRKLLFILLAIVLVIVGVFVWRNGNKTAGDLNVTALNWVRSINIEENRMFSESGWELPDGAKQTDAKKELHHYDQVLDHYEDVQVRRSRQVVDHYETYYTYSDNGNGTYSEIPHERPVYTTEYYTETVKQPVYRSVPREILLQHLALDAFPGRDRLRRRPQRRLAGIHPRGKRARRPADRNIPLYRRAHGEEEGRAGNLPAGRERLDEHQRRRPDLHHREAFRRESLYFRCQGQQNRRPGQRKITAGL